MALGKNSRGGDGRNSSNYCSTVPVAVFVAFCLVGLWIAMSSIVPVQDSVMEVSETINEVKNIANQTDSTKFENSLGDVQEESATRDSETPKSQSESHSESVETETMNGQSDDNQLRGSTETLDESKSDKSLDDSKLGTENSLGEITQQDENVGESKEEKINESLQSMTNQSTGDSNVESNETLKEETLVEARTENGTWSTQVAESERDKEPQTSSISIDSSKYDWKLCNTTSGSEYIPCLDNWKAIKKLRSISHYQHRERHCPDEVPTCLVSLPEGYRSPIRWPKSREMIWYNNAPHTKLVESKGHQNWIKVSGEYLTFPGGGTQFKYGALHYIEFIQNSLPNIAWGKRSRVILDVGCGVASFGGYLFEKDVLTMSFAPKDVHDQTMEALRLSTAQPHLPLLRRHRHHHHGMQRTTLQPNPCFKPFIAPALSKPVEIVPSPLLSESPLSPPLPPPFKASTASLQYPPGYVGAIPERSRSDDGDALVSPMSYLTNILTSKVYDVAKESPLEFAPKISERIGANIWLKREDLQPVYSFKIRGAYNMMAKLPEEVLEKGVICSSAGNHAQGVALSAKRLNCNAVIAMPVTTPDIKWKSVERLGATVVLIGDSYDEAQAYAKKRAIEEGRTFIPPFDHPDVIMGQGTVGMEILRQMKGPIHAIFVPVGGGGLIAGIAAYVKRINPEVKIIGVEPTDANAMALSLHHGHRVILDQVGGFADGVAVKEVGIETFRLCKELVDGVVLVSRDAICASIKDMFEEKRSILEPAGALALAGAEAYCKYYGLKGENVIAITSGANMNFDKLRTVTELANIGRKQEALLLTVLREEPGSFKQFCQLVGPMNITEFKYRYNSEEKAVVLYSVGIHTPSELKQMEERMGSSQLVTHNLTDVDLVKDHLRHMMGARPDIQNEVLCRFTFPERPGALMKFLDSFSPRWNISLFHYRAQGETGANVLVGIQVPSNEMDEFHDSANKLGYDYKVVMDDLFFQLLMH